MPERSCYLPPSYNVVFDIQNFNEPLIRKNLETDLGERFNAQISRVEYYFEGNLLKNPLHNEPFVQIIKSGIENRKKYEGAHDRKRELAELEGFWKVQTDLLDENREVKVIAICPRGPEGSCYRRNFFDLYERKNSGEILMTRYSSQITTDQFTETVRKIEPDYGKNSDCDDIYFLQNPIKTTITTDEILQIFQPDREALSPEQLENIVAVCKPLIDAYIGEPSEKIRRALLNFADDIALRPNTQVVLENQVKNKEFLPIVIDSLAARPVRFVVTGCGAQGSFQANASFLPYSVSEFGQPFTAKSEDTSDFPCPRCGHIITYGSGTKKCPGCGLAATCG